MSGVQTSSRLRRDERVMVGLLIVVAAAIVAGHLSWPSPLQFLLSVAAVIPLAGLIGVATEELSDRLGGRIGGLFNATFGNAPDILVGVFGVQKGLIPLVKATLVGALISNTALIMGLCFVVAGIAHRRPRFDRREAGHHGVLLLLTVAALLFPTVGAFVICGSQHCGGPSSPAAIQAISVGISLILLVIYAAYVVFGIFGLEGRGDRRDREGSVARRMGAAAAGGSRWPVWVSLLILGGATVALVPVVDILTTAVTPVTTALGWTQVFVGVVVVANAGNAAEAYAAIRFALQRQSSPSPGDESGLDLSISIASASSVQIATFVLPVVVLYSLFVHPMTLAFSGVEVAILGLLSIVFGAICHDGESNWLEGAQLLALYGMAAVVFFALPVAAFGT